MTEKNVARSTILSTDWAAIVQRIQCGDSSGAEYLCQLLSVQCRGRLSWGVDAQGIEDGLHDIVVTVLEAIHGGTLREPARLMGFAKTLTQRRVSRHIRRRIAVRKRFVPLGQADFPAPLERSPEALILAAEQAETLRRTLQCLRRRDRELLIRYYYSEQNPLHICQEMQLTPTQFRLFKSRALARCAEVARRSWQVPAGRRKPRPQADNRAPRLDVRSTPLIASRSPIPHLFLPENAGGAAPSPGMAA